jgi:hypothetical protein
VHVVLPPSLPSLQGTTRGVERSVGPIQCSFSCVAMKMKDFMGLLASASAAEAAADDAEAEELEGGAEEE